MTKRTRQLSGKPADCITLRGIHASGVHGVLEAEHHQPQNFVVDISLWFDSRAAARVDDLALTIDYAAVTDKILSVVRGKSVALIERLAQRIAMKVLEDERIDAVEVTVHKPQAPLKVEFGDVSIEIYRTREDFEKETARLAVALTVRPEKPRAAVLALGANLGDPVKTLREVVSALQSAPEFDEVAVSPLARTRPVLASGQAPQPDYYNAVVRLVSRLSASELLDLAHHFEQVHHRERPSHWAARTLDVDVIAVEGVESSDPRLTLPHPRAASRAFVLVPWAKLDATAKLGGELVAELATKAEDRDGIVNLWPDWLEVAPDTERTNPWGESVEAPDSAASENSVEEGTETSVLGTPRRASEMLDGNYGLPSWQAALGTGGEHRVVDDVTGEIFLDRSSSSSGNGGESVKSESTEQVTKPGWRRVRKHEAS
ncbi:MAG: 2-amino-4-hydroxy-6-hydroxymethyldihydropteridine diphosphokinase [Mobiluncus porci]|uniref:2-amino-4-hydroxy-6- hydroxymethyldihydropteridine diphosphokinase n=1 Tax=Mobiluncus porci TaxID=2652278 RepID=UPI0023F05DF4|nr:2-amino-4-hydroxy-6-hydroxymethyldihydropteridine diphosphokinase [Mobiluncus porci]MDD7542360.1 2-amino-4-hydroxy-6-hydroxymethyldihydropteridine diphosphokinase [Mobiluncus porci]MDY5747669.1 2-amino-4-hydroxy-6-hydroxymethyldihydropteridine diphosphokinase [Mobiluncus porci]